MVKVKRRQSWERREGFVLKEVAGQPVVLLLNPSLSFWEHYLCWAVVVVALQGVGAGVQRAGAVEYWSRGCGAEVETGTV